MRILIHGINYAPDEIGIPKYTTEMAEWFAARGHDVKVITAPPYYPDWRVPAAYARLRRWRETRKGVRIVRCPIYVPDNPTGARRLLHLLSFTVTSALPVIATALFWRPHIVMGIAPALMSAPAAWLAARVAGGAAWLHLQDFELDAAYEMRLLSSLKARRVAGAIERWILRRFDRVSTISEKMMEGLARKGVNREAIRELRNWVDLTSIHPLNRPSPYRTEWETEADSIICLYSGNIANKQGMEIITGAADALASQPRIKFVVCGQGSGRDAFASLAESRSNVTLLPLQPVERLNELLNAADIHMLPQKAGATDLVLPSKLTGMLASGRPVVATAESGSGLALELVGCGVITPPGDPHAFADAIQALADSEKERQLLGRAARSAAEERLNVDIILQQAASEMSHIGSVNSTPNQGGTGAIPASKGK